MEKEKILIIDNDEAYLFSISAILSKHLDAEIVVESNPKKAIEMLSHCDDFAVILIDIHMPLIDGFEAAKIMKESEISSPIIFLTGYPMDKDVEEKIKKTNASDFVTKSSSSISFFLLVNKIKMFLENKRYYKKKNNKKEIKCKYIFDNAPISLWEEDISEIKKMMLNLREEIGPDNIKDFLSSHPNFVLQAINNIRIKNANKTSLKLFKAESLENLKLSLHSLFTEETYSTFKKYLLYLANGEDFISEETTFKNINGDKIFCHISIVIPENENEAIVTIVDLSEIKRLERREQNLHSFISKSPIVAFQLKFAPNWPIEFISERSHDLLGYSPEDLMSGKISWASTTYHDDLKRVEEEIAKYAISNQKEELCIQCRIITAKREIKWVKIICTILKDIENKPVTLTGIMYDISKEVNMQNKLAESLNKWKMLIESTKTAYIILNEKGIIVDANKIILELLDCEKQEDLLGLSPRALISKDHIGKYDQAINHLLANGENIENLELSIEPNNLVKCKPTWVSMNAGLIENGEKKIFCLLRDITSIKIEELRKFITGQKQKDKLKQNISKIREQIQEIKKIGEKYKND